MHSLLDLLLYRHRRFKGETYFRSRFPIFLVISGLFAAFLADSFSMFFIIIVLFLAVDLLLSLGAWLYYKTDL